LIDIDRYTFRGYIPTELGVITTVPTCSTPSIAPLRGTLGFHHRYVQMFGNDASMAKQLMFTRFHSFNQWEFPEPKFEVPTIYKAYFSGLCKGMSPENMAKHMVQFHALDPEIHDHLNGFSQRQNHGELGHFKQDHLVVSIVVSNTYGY
jgi:hypothetical protein